MNARPHWAASSNSPFRAPSKKQSHSKRLNTRIRPAGSPVPRISTRCSPSSRANATSMPPEPWPEPRQAAVLMSTPSSSTEGLARMAIPSGFPRNGRIEPPRTVVVGQLGILGSPQPDMRNHASRTLVRRNDLHALEEPSDLGLGAYDAHRDSGRGIYIHDLANPPRDLVVGGRGRKSEVAARSERADVLPHQR